MKVQTCQFGCDVGGCKHKSLPASNWTEARKLAEGAGWFVRPAESQPEHVCSDCVSELLGGVKLTVPAEDAPDQGERTHA